MYEMTVLNQKCEAFLQNENALDKIHADYSVGQKTISAMKPGQAKR